MSQQDGFALIDQFFQAISLRQPAVCQDILAQLSLLSEQQPNFGHWHTYLYGVMTNEFDHDRAEAERIFRSLLSIDIEAALMGRVLTGLGIIYRQQGRWQAALDVYERCLTTFDQPNHLIERVKIWKNMAIVLDFGYTQGDFSTAHLQQAIQYCQQALDALATIETPSDDHIWLEATTWDTLGLVHKNLQDWANATHCYEHSMALSTRLDDTYGLGVTHHNLGEVLQRQGSERWADAQNAYQQALAIFRAFDNITEQMHVLSNLGSLHRDMGQIETALDDHYQALDLAESLRIRLTAPVSQADYRTTIDTVYSVPLTLHLERGEFAQAFDVAERARSRVLADLLVGQVAKPHADIPVDLLTQRDTLRQLLDDAYGDEHASDKIEGLEMALADVDRQIDLYDPTYASLDTIDPLTITDVQQRLSEKAVVLTYVADNQDHLWVMVVSRTDIQAQRIDQPTFRWLSDYLLSCLDGPRRGGLLPRGKAGYLSQPQLYPMLYQALIAPVWNVLKAMQAVYIIPFGPLHYFPIGALTPTLSQLPPLLTERRRVVYAPSATILFTYCHNRPQSPYQGLLAIAPQDDRLQLTIGAAENLATMMTGVAVTGSRATRQAFLDNAIQQRIVCFLGHALFDQQHPMASRLKFVDGSLHASEILRHLRLQADLVILSACETGRTQVLRGDEMLGLSRALLYAGTPALLVTLWAVHEIPTRLLVEKLITTLSEKQAAGDPFTLAQILAATQVWLRDLTAADTKTEMIRWASLTPAEVDGHLRAIWHMTQPGQPLSADERPFAHPFFWSPYVLIGEGNPQ
ncbi:MAG: CHAT domain-containing protein [Chloroflexota bacterium]